ncbi:MAG: S9 family peptidase [Saprospiraceae bacterium]|nr:S9 family peptidase [Saprospiraceae bacterium]
MKKIVFTTLLIAFLLPLQAQLTIEKIMEDPKISVGALPSGIFWSEDSKTVYFNWNPELNKGDSLYGVEIPGGKPYKLSPEQRKSLPANGIYNRDHSKRLYSKNGDLFLLDCATMQERALTNTTEAEYNASFNADETQVLFTRSNNLYSLHIGNGALKQWTNFQTGSPKPEPKANEQEKWLKKDQLALFDVLEKRASDKKEADKNAKSEQPKRPKEIFLDDKRIDDIQLSPDARYVTYRLSVSSKNEKRTIVPSYVTESGFTEDIPARTKVGSIQTSQEFWIYDLQRDTNLQVSTAQLEGISDQPEYLKVYQTAKDSTKTKKTENRKIYFGNLTWSENGQYAVLSARSLDNKDRWILRLEPSTNSFKTLDRLHDEAWVSNNFVALGFLDAGQKIYFQSEADGYAHLYTLDIDTGQKNQLTKGAFEVQNVRLSKDKQFFYLTTNEVHPGEQHYYRMSVTGGERKRLTQKSGAYQVNLSTDETKLAYLYSTPTQPWELFIQDNNPQAQAVQITKSQSPQFQSYSWREPKIVTIRARDGANVYARLYEGKGKNGKKPAVVFVHGAGYLQNAHRWWSTYFREYMFHNFLVDNGYTVLDMDYRGSAGYGRDWRTGIYRYMGDKDLSDHVDGAEWLVNNQGVDPKRIGIYGGSYGGFITLMAMFTTPDVFKSGAALRPVTDWSAYNHGYTANILNEPQTDSIAYRRSSPIYHAEGLKGHLLICHGMIDVNVHFQDAVRLSQRLIELKKENWELAAYPMEDHGFVEPTSWMDEYKRIFKLFERTLK